jgi:uncharacterized protein (TIGR03000 family)
MRNERMPARSVWALTALLLAGAPAARAQDQPATLIVRLPADARLLVEGRETKARGEVRRFHSPPLAAGQTFRYTLEASWTEDNKPVRRTRTVRVRAGEQTDVDLRVEDKSVEQKSTGKTPTAKPPKERVPDVAPPDNKPKERPPAARPPADKHPDAGDSVKTDVPFVPTPQEVVDKMLELAGVKKDDMVYDLGCGDGRIVVSAARKYGCKAVGFDIDPKRVEESLANVKDNRVGDLVTIEKKNIFSVDLSKASVVTLYLLPDLNVRLIPQLEKMKPGSRIVSHQFGMDGVKPKREATVTDKEGHDHKIYLWEVPLQKE